MMRLLQNHEIEIKGRRYFVRVNGLVFAKDGPFITSVEILAALNKAFDLDAQAEIKRKEAESLLYCDACVEFSQEKQKWCLYVFDRNGKPHVFAFDSLDAVLSTIKSARDVCDGKNSEVLIETLRRIRSKKGSKCLKPKK